MTRRRHHKGGNDDSGTNESGSKESGEKKSKSSELIQGVGEARSTAQALKGEIEAILICVVLFLITIVMYTAGDEPSIFRYALCVSFMSMTFAASGSFLLFKSMKSGTIAVQEYILMGIMAMSLVSWCFFVYELYNTECD